jgi:hypothetical protein
VRHCLNVLHNDTVGCCAGDTLGGMDDITPAAWAVLQAAHDLQVSDDEASIDTSAVRSAALALVGGTDAALDFEEPGGTYAGIEAQIWALERAGYVGSTSGWRRRQRQGSPHMSSTTTTACTSPTKVAQH